MKTASEMKAIAVEGNIHREEVFNKLRSRFHKHLMEIISPLIEEEAKKGKFTFAVKAMGSWRLNRTELLPFWRTLYEEKDLYNEIVNTLVSKWDEDYHLGPEWALIERLGEDEVFLNRLSLELKDLGYGVIDDNKTWFTIKWA